MSELAADVSQRGRIGYQKKHDEAPLTITCSRPDLATTQDRDLHRQDCVTEQLYGKRQLPGLPWAPGASCT